MPVKPDGGKTQLASTLISSIPDSVSIRRGYTTTGVGAVASTTGVGEVAGTDGVVETTGAEASAGTTGAGAAAGTTGAGASASTIGAGAEITFGVQVTVVFTEMVSDMQAEAMHIIEVEEGTTTTPSQTTTLELRL